MSAPMNNDGNQLQPNDTWSRPLDAQFVNNLHRIKYQLYEKAILHPSLNAQQSQDNAILNTYLSQLTTLHDLSRRAQIGRLPVVSTIALTSFPQELHQEIEGILQWISRYFQTNGPAKTIPYTHYLESTLRVYPFVQNPDLTYKDVEMTDEMDYSSNML